MPAWASPTKVEAEDAADHHVVAQGQYPGGLDSSWEWQFGTGKSAKNITGITAQGLLAAHRLSGLDEHQKSAVRAARSLIQAYDRGWKKHRPYTQDVEFLAAAGFVIDAGKWFRVTQTRFSPAAYVDYVISGRRAGKRVQVAGWDLASAIRAALAVGQVEYAKGLLSELLRRQGEWDRPGLGRDLSRGSLLWAMAELRTRAGLGKDETRAAEGLVLGLTASQLRSGAWLEATRGTICTQTTAYAILGLSRWSAGKRAAARGRAWLTRSARTDRRFIYGGRIWATTYSRDGRPQNNYNAEIQSEVLMALATTKD
jgi:hypothetical protein